jgi:hypothetical protein
MFALAENFRQPRAVLQSIQVGGVTDVISPGMGMDYQQVRITSRVALPVAMPALMRRRPKVLELVRTAGRPVALAFRLATWDLVVDTPVLLLPTSPPSASLPLFLAQRCGGRGSSPRSALAPADHLRPCRARWA